MNSSDEKITFLKWWEGKRLLFNVVVLIGFALSFAFFGGFLATSSIPISIYLAFFLLINLLYSISSLVDFIFKFTIRNFENASLNSFFQSKRLWQFLFILKILIALLGVLIVVGGVSAERGPYNYNYF